MNVGSLFTGIAGFDLGFERAGFEIAYQSEIDRQCDDILIRHYPHVPQLRDVRGIRNPAIVDVLVGGFPCQDVSYAGRREGLYGPRSSLFFEFARILDESRPEWCVIENVSGLLSSNDGRDMGAVLGTLAELGYGFAYRVLDAAYFGVPQRRRRVFIVGHLGDPRRASEVLFDAACSPRNPRPRHSKEKVTAALTANSFAGTGADDNRAQARHLVAVGSLGARGERGFNDADSAAAGHLIPEQIGVRRLLPLEAERLQGFPDDWTAGVADSHRYRMLGNAVAVPVAQWIAERLSQIASHV